MELPLRMLFLCTGNSCRSIIAEALANQLGEGRLEAYSAGSHPTGRVNPHDLIITVCDAAAGESCPVWLGDAVKAHWGVPDPADVTDPELIEPAFERTFRQMERRLAALLRLPLEQMEPAELAAALGDIQRGVNASAD